MKPSTPLESCDQRGHGGVLGFTDNALLLKTVFAAPAENYQNTLGFTLIPNVPPRGEQKTKKTH